MEVKPEPPQMTTRTSGFWHECFEKEISKDQINEIFERAIEYFEKMKEEKENT